MRLLWIAIGAASLAIPASASPCGKVDAKAGAVSAIEETVLSQDWKALAKQLAGFPQEEVEATLADAGEIRIRYTRCEVIFAQRLPPAIGRRAVVFYSGEAAALFLYLETVDLNGRAVIVRYQYAPSLGPLMDLIR